MEDNQRKMITVIDGNHSDFKSRADKILDIYNAESKSPFDEVLSMSKPESMHLIYVEGVEGGVITDLWRNKSGEAIFHSVMFAAFPKEERRKGYLKACLDNAGFPIETVQINGGDPIEIWKRLGFTKVGTLGLSIMMRSTEFPNVKWGSCVL